VKRRPPVRPLAGSRVDPEKKWCEAYGITVDGEYDLLGGQPPVAKSPKGSWGERPGGAKDCDFKCCY
jgi:hypothetical protein